MPLFPKDTRLRRKAPEPHDVTKDAQLTEELSELAAANRPREVDRARGEAEQAINNAAMADIRGITLIERGRCPDCGGRTEAFLFTTICPSCGWYRRGQSDLGTCVVCMDDGEIVECDKVFEGRQNVLLCVKDNHVCAQLAHSHVRRINYEWADGELEVAWDRFRKQRKGVCAWCEKALGETDDEEEPIEEYVAFGAYQERYLVCSRKCLAAFRKQYPTRIHRNCYETDCNTCKACIKRFDTTNFVRLKTVELD